MRHLSVPQRRRLTAYIAHKVTRRDRRIDGILEARGLIDGSGEPTALGRALHAELGPLPVFDRPRRRKDGALKKVMEQVAERAEKRRRRALAWHFEPLPMFLCPEGGIAVLGAPGAFGIFVVQMDLGSAVLGGDVPNHRHVDDVRSFEEVSAAMDAAEDLARRLFATSTVPPVWIFTSALFREVEENGIHWRLMVSAPPPVARGDERDGLWFSVALVLKGRGPEHSHGVLPGRSSRQLAMDDADAWRPPSSLPVCPCTDRASA